MDREEWLRRRRFGVSGTDIGILLGVNPYKTVDDIVLDKLGIGEKFTGNAATRTGKLLEPYVANQWAKDKQKILINGEFTVSSEYEWAIGTPDFLYPGGVLEVKTGAEKTYRKGLPKHYEAQLQWYMLITGRTEGVLTALIVPKDRSECPQSGDDPDYIWEWCANRPRRDYPVLLSEDRRSHMLELAGQFAARMDRIRASANQGLRPLVL